MPKAKGQTKAPRIRPADSPYASDAALNLALKHQLRDLKGSGRNGKITLADVRSAVTTVAQSRARETGSSLAEIVREDGKDKGLLPSWTANFIASLTVDPNVSKAAAVAGVSRMHVYRMKEEIPIFSELWEEAVEISTDALETEARRRALEGVEEPVYYEGISVGTVRVYSDKLMALLLRAHRPKQYAERSILEGTFQHEHQGRVVQPSEEGERRLAALVERLSCHLGLPPKGSEDAGG